MALWIAVAGTRPEITKLWSVVEALRRKGSTVEVWLTGQHDQLLVTTADSDRLRALLAGAVRLGVPTSGDPGVFAGRVTEAVAARLAALDPPPMGLLVQGDTASAYGAAVAGRQVGVRVAHIEAGVRTHDVANPWPEEVFRVAIDRVAHWLFAPTETCKTHLVEEGLAFRGDLQVTGNTGIDDLVADLGDAPRGAPQPRVLVTLHRRETLARLAEVVAALNQVAAWRPAFAFVWPVHPNPAVLAAADHAPRIERRHAMGAHAFRTLLAASHLVVTDSGGVQEEAAFLGVPCLVVRDVTDRPESVAAQRARVVGTDPGRVAEAVRDELDTPTLSRVPFLGYGTGQAGAQIAAALMGS